MTTENPPGKFDGPASAEALELWEEYLDTPAPPYHVDHSRYEQDAFTSGYDVGRRAGYEAALAELQDVAPLEAVPAPIRSRDIHRAKGWI